MPYIPYKQMQQLREAARNGDERAKKILCAQLNDEDYCADLEEYFNPKTEPEPVQEQEPVVEKQPETAQVQETGNESDISKAILAVISACDASTLDIVNNPEIQGATKTGALSILGEIKQSCLDNLEKFGKLMSSIAKKEDEEDEI